MLYEYFCNTLKINFKILNKIDFLLLHFKCFTKIREKAKIKKRTWEIVDNYDVS